MRPISLHLKGKWTIRNLSESPELPTVTHPLLTVQRRFPPVQNGLNPSG